jgi:hypothetical protein
VLLTNPRWERRLVKFLELSEVERMMADGAVDHVGNGGGGHVGGGGFSDTLSFLFFSISQC